MSKRRASPQSVTRKKKAISVMSISSNDSDTDSWKEVSPNSSVETSPGMENAGSNNPSSTVPMDDTSVKLPTPDRTNDSRRIESPRKGVRDPSHDGTVILPDCRPIYPSPSSGVLVPYRPPDSFPVFHSGDVVIKTELAPNAQCFQLHSAVLRRHSVYFANEIPQDPDSPGASWHLFSIKEVKGKPAIIRHKVEGTRPIEPPRLDLAAGVPIKEEDTSDDAASRPIPTSSITYYRDIFGIFYNISPPISSQDLGKAFAEAEELVKIGTDLGCLQLLRPHLGNVFSNYRQNLFIAIKSDPARWILLATALENKSIYTECLVHLIGAHPRWPQYWKTPRTAFPDTLRKLIADKSTSLAEQRTHVDLQLLLSTLEYNTSRRQTGAIRRPPNPTLRGETETWLTVAVFRDQLQQRISAFEDQRRFQAPLERGTFYRHIHKGTLPELGTENVRGILKSIMKLEWAELGDDLQRLKDYAADLVQDLAVNELMIDPDANNVGYLTCAKIRDEDIPWLAGASSATAM